ncbi:acyloxyacyl hydrolase [Thalassotalea sp. M1531]|uniref:Acyloxyacyl hydrolase n=1 Tax=Thalassotalea algicola TaxID=2716224 RepID=A0A7Y0LFM8_9GAMM|nr:acyloxyacyl hydrolase [Thalassotalea algicola]
MPLNNHALALSLSHYSNAATNSDNDGTNIVSLEYSIAW